MKVYSQLVSAALEVKSSDYSTGIVGLIWWNSTAKQVKIGDTTSAITNFLLNNEKCIFGRNGTANNNIRFHRGAAGVLQFVQGGDSTSEGTLSTSLNQISARLENYTDAGKPNFGNAGRVAWISDVGALKVDTGSAWATVATNSAADRLLAMYDAVVGSAGEVSSGVATHSTITAAIAAVSAGASIFILDGTFTETVSVNKQLYIVGKGKASVIDGTLTFTSSSDQSHVKDLRVTGAITFDSGADGNFLVDCFQATGQTVSDQGDFNTISLYQE